MNEDLKTFDFRKSLGQNFIADTNLLSAIVRDASVCPQDVVIEIGAGAGALTQQLCKSAKHVIAYEIDERLQPILASALSEFNNVEVHFCDFLKQDLAQLDGSLDGYRVVANLPYYVTTPIITALCEQTVNCKSITVMVQQEVAERMAACSGKEYGALSVCVQSRGEVKLARKVSRKLFNPIPNVDSAVINITFCDKYDKECRTMMRKVVRAAFASRRKTLANNLSTSFGIARPLCVQLLAQCGLSDDVRAERVSVQQFALLAKSLSTMVDL